MSLAADMRVDGTNIVVVATSPNYTRLHPHYPRSMQSEEQIFPPALLMSQEERRRAKQLLRELSKHYEARRVDELKARADQKGYEHFRAARKTIDTNIDSLAAEVLKRELGLERYMVIHAIRTGGHKVHMQVLSFGIDGEWRRPGWAWILCGRKLRKDQTLGELPEYMHIDSGVIRRRRLDGEWVALSVKSPRGLEDVADSE